jgi:hypothetical protein
MPATKTSRTLLTSQSLGAGATVNATEWNQTTAYGGLLCVRLSLPGSAPTTAPVVRFFVGEATGVKRLFYTATASTTAGDYPLDFVCELPQGTMFANATIVNGATNAINVDAFGQELTNI